jgi:16S rRNA (guanine966-N2)-methyltransferase
VRVIAGLARGRQLVAPAGRRTRPTSDKVKGALFSILETQLAVARPGNSDRAAADVGSPELWEGLSVLDLYAGSGALGIEALSRGAAWCDFVESDPGARQTIERNLRVTDLIPQARVFAVTAEKVVTGVARAALHAPYDLVLLDPPYDLNSLELIVDDLARSDFLSAGALVAVEHAAKRSLASHYRAAASVAEAWPVLTAVRERRHGDTTLTIYRRETFGERGEAAHGLDGDLPG